MTDHSKLISDLKALIEKLQKLEETKTLTQGDRRRLPPQVKGCLDGLKELYHEVQQPSFPVSSRERMRARHSLAYIASVHLAVVRSPIFIALRCRLAM